MNSLGINRGGSRGGGLWGCNPPKALGNYTQNQGERQRSAGAHAPHGPVNKADPKLPISSSANEYVVLYIRYLRACAGSNRELHKMTKNAMSYSWDWIMQGFPWVTHGTELCKIALELLKGLIYASVFCINCWTTTIYIIIYMGRFYAKHNLTHFASFAGYDCQTLHGTVLCKSSYG